MFDSEHKTFGDRILAGICPFRMDGDLRLFYMETHCTDFWIVARVSKNPTSYEVLQIFESDDYDKETDRRANAFYDIELKNAS
jgi:hypothetical protein